ncbi:hypothetical protein U1Q18_008757 [Sarracenia purpurea var. burkii]
MDNREKQKLQTTSQPYQLLKNTLKFVISISLSLFLVSSSPGISHFFQSFNFHFSQLLFPFLGQTLERKYAFLICNGIVVVLAKNFSLTNPSSPGSGLTDNFEKKDGVKSVSEIEAPLKDKEATLESVTESLENVSALEEEENGIFNIHVPERESLSVITGAEDDDDNEEEEEDDDAELEESESLIPQSSAEDEGNEVNVSTEELNKKFEEFIRKMKEEIRIGAQQKLIAV